jgi:trk system potassium uptake protein TrkA
VKVLIIGCGRVGSKVAADFDKEGHEVTIVDKNSSAFAQAAWRGVLAHDFKGNQMVGDGTDVDFLRKAGIEDADGFVAVTQGDNRNIMAAQIAKHVFKVPRVIARMVDPEREAVYRKLGIHTLCPTLDSARAIQTRLLEK